MSDLEAIKKLREETGVSISECKKALTEAGGDFEKAKEILKKWGREFSEKKAQRETGAGIVDFYIHPNKQVGALILLSSESDFVARSTDFKELAHEICLQVAAIDPKETELLDQPWIKDPSKTIKDLINEYISKLGENIVVKNVARFEV